MYCPQCGSKNQDDLKFCTHCGTNLGIVSDALSGKLDQPAEVDERLVNLLKNYYSGRRNAGLGFVMTAIFSFKLALTLLIWNSATGIPFVLLFTTLIILGLIWLMWGTTKWNNASSELKALGYDDPKRALPKPKPAVNILPAESTLVAMSGKAADLLRTDPLAVPPSITEQTTNLLKDEKASAPPPRPVSN